jgi:hypothetical protein
VILWAKGGFLIRRKRWEISWKGIKRVQLENLRLMDRREAKIFCRLNGARLPKVRDFEILSRDLALTDPLEEEKVVGVFARFPG